MPHFSGVFTRLLPTVCLNLILLFKIVPFMETKSNMGIYFENFFQKLLICASFEGMST